VKLGWGEYGPEPLAVRRRYFLAVVFEIEPQSLSELTDPLFYADDSEDDPVNVFRLADALCKHLAAWQRRWHLADQWCFETALTFLRSHDHSSGAMAHALLCLSEWFKEFAQFCGVVSCDTRPELEALTWDPSRITWANFEQELSAYRNRIEASVSAQGFEKTPDKRNPEHHRWLARYQVKGKSVADIWRSLNGDNRTSRAVEKAVQDTADDIGLTLRQ
jgi:hypothetical protein